MTNDLTILDAFHPPATNDQRKSMYDEWHYFNVMDVNQNVFVIITLGLNGNIYDPNTGIADMLLGYVINDVEDGVEDIYTPSQAQWSATKPDITIGNNYVTYSFAQNQYHVYIQSKDGKTTFDATFVPQAVNSPVMDCPLNNNQIISYLIASPKMNVNGSLTTPTKTYTLRNVIGYHDHNWGYWLWDSDMGWNWGQAVQYDTKIYSLVVWNVTNRNHSTSYNNGVYIWKNDTILRSFKDNEIQVKYSKITCTPEYPDICFPMTIEITSTSGTNNLKIVFNADSYAPLEINPRILWELGGTYTVSGNIAGNNISYQTYGVFEYIGPGTIGTACADPTCVLSIS